LTWDLGTLTTSSTAVVRLTVKINDDATPGTVLTNSAAVTDAAGDEAAASADLTVVAK